MEPVTISLFAPRGAKVDIVVRNEECEMVMHLNQVNSLHFFLLLLPKLR